MSRYKVLRGMGDRWRLGSGVIDHGLLPYVCGTRTGHWKRKYDGCIKHLSRIKKELGGTKWADSSRYEPDTQDKYWRWYWKELVHDKTRAGWKRLYTFAVIWQLKQKQSLPLYFPNDISTIGSSHIINSRSDVISTIKYRQFFKS